MDICALFVFRKILIFWTWSKGWLFGWKCHSGSGSTLFVGLCVKGLWEEVGKGYLISFSLLSFPYI